MISSRPPPPRKRTLSLRSRAVRGLIYQVLALALIALGVWFLAYNTLENMRSRGIQSGFDFLLQPAGFDIGESLIPYESIRPYWQAFLVGMVNTLRVALIGIVLTTLLGTLLGVGRFSSNALVRGLCYAYVELFRNVPILLQLLVWYLLMTEWLPDSDAANSLMGLVFLSKGGLAYPVPVWELAHGLALIGVGFVQLFQAGELRREPTSAGGVDDQHHLAFVARQGQGLVVDALCFEVIKAHGWAPLAWFSLFVRCPSLTAVPPAKSANHPIACGFPIVQHPAKLRTHWQTALRTA
jgi:His/Glu/Gln/Arg/opine family amino acid ABC transporter permease subunit